MSIAIFGTMILLLLLGFPMMIPLIAGSLIGFVSLFGGMGQLDTMVQQILAGIRPASLIAVPMFIFAADIMTRGQSAGRLIDLVMAFVGHLKGGLAMSTAAACTLFGAVSGSAAAAASGIGSFMIPVPFPHEPDARERNLQMRGEAMAHLGRGGAIVLFPSGSVAASETWFGPAVEAAWNPFTAKMIRSTVSWSATMFAAVPSRSGLPTVPSPPPLPPGRPP